MTYPRKLARMALTAAIALAVVACDAGDGHGTRPNEAAAGRTGPTGAPEPSWASAFLDPLTNEQAARDLFEVETPHPEYWRLVTLDRFDGETWQSSDPDGSREGQALHTPATLPQGPGSAGPKDTITATHTFRMLSDLDVAPALPIAPIAERIEGPFGEIIWDPYREQAFIDGPLEPGMEYTVRSRIVVPTPEELDRVDHLTPRTYGRWTELPADIDPRFAWIAERWTAGATSDYRKVLAIQERFQRADFVYSTDVAGLVDADALLDFLTRTRTGFCVHYTGAMTVMVRALGLPARVAIGYRTGTRQEDGRYLVRADDAHVWVEVFFPGYGWLPFEPEHGTAHPDARPGTYLAPIDATA